MIKFYTQRRDLIVGLFLFFVISFCYSFSMNEEFEELHDIHNPAKQVSLDCE